MASLMILVSPVMYPINSARVLAVQTSSQSSGTPSPELTAKLFRLKSDLQYPHLSDRVFIKLKKQSLGRIEYSHDISRYEGTMPIAGAMVRLVSLAQTMIHDPEVATKLANSDVYNWQVAQVPEGMTVQAFLESVLADPNVASAEPICMVHSDRQVSPTDVDSDQNDPVFPRMWGLYNSGVSGGVAGIDVNALKAWPILEQYLIDHPDAPQVLVSSIDTGIYYLDDDLKNFIWTNPGEIPDNGIDDDNDGIVDDVHGYNAIDNATRPGDPLDDNNHGTHTSGTIGAGYRNGIGTVGIIGPFQSNIHIIGAKFLDADGAGTYDNAVKALLYSYDHHALISNNSWGGSQRSQVLYDVIKAGQQLGVIVVASAGNLSSNTSIIPQYPEAFSHEAGDALDNVVPVGAIDRTGQLAYFSNYGPGVDIAAPGQEIVSTIRDNKYVPFSGTSMSAPHVSGAFAIISVIYPRFDYHQKIKKLLDCARPLVELEGLIHGAGMLDIYNILEDDSIAPDPVRHLKIPKRLITPHSLTISWTASGDDGNKGQATQYDIRFSKDRIDEINFVQATPIKLTPLPEPSGTKQTCAIPELDSETKYFVAIKVRDNVSNWSLLSTVVIGTTKKGQ